MRPNRNEKSGEYSIIDWLINARESELPDQHRQEARSRLTSLPQLCSLKNPIVPSSSSVKRSISSGVVVKPRLARAVPARP